MPVQYVYPERYSKGSSPQYTNGHIKLFNQNNVEYGPTTSYLTQSEYLADYLFDIDEGVSSPNDNDLLRFVGVRGGNGASNFNVLFPQYQSNGDVPHNSLTFKYGELLVNPQFMNVRMRAHASGFAAIVVARAYDGDSLIGTSQPISLSGVRNLEFPIYTSSRPSHFYPEVKFSFYSSGVNNPIYVTDGNTKFIITSSDIYCSGDSQFARRALPLIQPGRVKTCLPIFSFADSDDDDSVLVDETTKDTNRTYRLFESGKFGSYLSRFRVSPRVPINSFGCSYVSGDGNIGSHIRFLEGSGIFATSNDKKYSGIVKTVGGNITQPAWFFNNRRISGQRFFNMLGNNESENPYINRVLDVVEDTQTISPTPAVITVNFIKKVNEIPGFEWVDPSFENWGGSTDFTFSNIGGPGGPTIVTSSSGAELVHPGFSPSTIFADNGSYASMASMIQAGINFKYPYNLPGSGVVVTPGFYNDEFNLKFTFPSNAVMPTLVQTGYIYHHMTEGVEYDYNWDFTVTYQSGTGGGGTITSKKVFYQNGISSLRNSAYNSSTALALGPYAYSGIGGGITQGVNRAYFSGLNRFPDGNFGLSVLYSDFSNDGIGSLGTYSDTDFRAVMDFDVGNNIRVIHSGSVDTYPMFKQEVRFRTGASTYQSFFNEYDATDIDNQAVTGFLLNYSGTTVSFSNIMLNGDIKKVIEGTAARYTNTAGLNIISDKPIGVNEIIISSGSPIGESDLRRYYKNNINNLPTDTNPSNYSLSSPRVVHHGPNILNKVPTSGSPMYALGDIVKLNGQNDYFSIPSGGVLKLDMVLHYSGNSELGLNAWVEKDGAGRNFSWTPFASGNIGRDSNQPEGYGMAQVSRGLRIFPGSGLHKITISGVVHTSEPLSMNNANMFLNFTYPDKPTAYSGGTLSVYALKCYSEDGFCRIPDEFNKSFDLATSGLGSMTSQINLYASGLSVVRNNVNMSMAGKLDMGSGLNLMVATMIPISNGITLFQPALRVRENMTLVTEGRAPDVLNSSKLDFSIFSSANKSLFNNVSLSLLSENVAGNITMFTKGVGEYGENGLIGRVPLFIGSDPSVSKSVNMFTTAPLGANSDNLNMTIIGTGFTEGGYAANDGIPLYMSRRGESVTNGVNMVVHANYSNESLDMIVGNNGDAIGFVDNAFGTSYLGFPPEVVSLDSNFVKSLGVTFFSHGF